MLFNKPLVTLFEMFIYQMLFTNVFLLLVLSLVGHAQRACESTNNKKRLGYTFMCKNISVSSRYGGDGPAYI